MNKIYRIREYTKEPLNGKDADKVLLEVNRQLKEMGVTYWVSAGTLLGIYRENRLIPDDTDIDFEVLGNPEGFALKNCELVKCAVGTRGFVYQLAYVFPENIIVDIMFYRDAGSHILSHTGKQEIGYKKGNFDITSLTYKGETIPCLEPEAYLTYMYGDWRTPRREKSKWDHLKTSGTE